MRQFVDNLVENVVEVVVKDENVSKQQILTVCFDQGEVSLEL